MKNEHKNISTESSQYKRQTEQYNPSELWGMTLYILSCYTT